MKSKYFARKCIYGINHNFCYYAYFPILKAKINSELCRRINRIKLKRLILPSSFKVVRDQTVQGPRIGIIYSSCLNFKKLPSLFKLKASCFKFKNNWYGFDLLQCLKLYKTPIDLCLTYNSYMENNHIKFYIYISLHSLKKS